MSEKVLAPDFSLPATGGHPLSLSAQQGKKVVLFFYPKDNTPGCTTEAHDFAERHAAFSAQNCVLIGLSRDSVSTHEKFKTKLQLPFELVSDTAEVACTAYGVMKEKKLYGKSVRGIERSTFVIDERGQILHAWRGVKVPGHAEAVLKLIQSL